MLTDRVAYCRAAEEELRRSRDDTRRLERIVSHLRHQMTPGELRSLEQIDIGAYYDGPEEKTTLERCE